VYNPPNFLHAEPVEKINAMYIVTYNIRYGLGRDGKYNLKRIAESLEGADVIALQEVERYWHRSGMVDQPQVIADLLPSYYWVYGPAFDADTSSRSADGAVTNRRRQFGTMLLSKTPILYSKLLTLDKIASTSCFNMDQGALEGVIETKLGTVRMYSLHLSALSERERVIQTRQLLAHHHNWHRTGGTWTGDSKATIMDWSQGDSRPAATPHAILMGDFNTLPNSETYTLLSGHHEEDYGRVSYVDEFVDSLCMVADGEKHAPFTYWTDEPDRNNKDQQRLDYCFVSAELADKVLNAYSDTKAEGSDHFPYWVEMNL
jgi:endonuclease/exonuclease/phosphatase family metal-dependent hydrolase